MIKLRSHPTELIPCGINVIMNNSKLDGVIIAIKIKFEIVVYKISYFKDDFKHIWMDISEFEIKDNYQPIKVGYNAKKL